MRLHFVFVITLLLLFSCIEGDNEPTPKLVSIPDVEHKHYRYDIDVLESPLYVDGKLANGWITVYDRTNDWLAIKFGVVDGIKQGEFKMWHAKDTLATQSFYVDGIQHGNHKEYFTNGKLQADKVYEMGTIVKEKLQSPEGEVLKNIVVRNGRIYGLKHGTYCKNGVVRNPENDSIAFYKLKQLND